MSRRGWLAALGVLGALNLRAAFVKHAGTFCHECLRRPFRTDTRAGKAAFVAAFGCFCCWFVPHILRWPADKPPSR